MFAKKTIKGNYTDALGKTNRIVEGTTIIGDIISPADFRLDGRLEGNFKTTGKLVIGPAGSVKGSITATNTDIEGKFEGKINVEDTLTLKATATVSGEVICGKIAIEPGANFTSSCEMRNNIKPTLNGNQPVEEKKK